MTRSRAGRAVATAAILGWLCMPVALRAADRPDFAPEQIEQMVAPIALHPDPLMTTILMAATYPLEVVQADRWVEANAALKGAELDRALQSRDWDESVKSLCRTPDVLARMSENLDWTSDLGDAFLAQQEDVLAAVQRMRKRAADQGNLTSTPQQTVVVEKEVIKVVPADPQVIYVPTYSAAVVYGPAWSYPTYYYPPMYAYPPGYVAGASLLSFGVGMAVGAAVWGNCNWGGGWSTCCGGWGGNDIDIDRNVDIGGDVNIGNRGDRTRQNVGNRGGGQQRWQHDAQHRRGVSYRNESVSRRYEGQRGEQRQISREQARGRTQGAAAARAGGERARQPGAQARAGSGDRVRQPSAQAQSGSRHGSTSRGSRESAFSGGRGGFERAASQRGSSSRGGYGTHRSAGSRGGGSRGGGRGGGRGRR